MIFGKGLGIAITYINANCLLSNNEAQHFAVNALLHQHLNCINTGLRVISYDSRIIYV